MMEVMNIKSIGPNLFLGPNALTNDSLFDVTLIEERQREEFAAYIKKLIAGKESTFNFFTVKARSLILNCEADHMHVDDELVVPFKNPINLSSINKSIKRCNYSVLQK